MVFEPVLFVAPLFVELSLPMGLMQGVYKTSGGGRTKRRNVRGDHRVREAWPWHQSCTRGHGGPRPEAPQGYDMIGLTPG